MRRDSIDAKGQAAGEADGGRAVQQDQNPGAATGQAAGAGGFGQPGLGLVFGIQLCCDGAHGESVGWRLLRSLMLIKDRVIARV